MPASSVRYAKKVRSILLSCGADGIKQSHLYLKTKTPSFPVQELLDLLEIWRMRQWVQRFQVTPLGSRRTATIWRATTKLRDEWPTLEHVADDIVAPED